MPFVLRMFTLKIDILDNAYSVDGESAAASETA